MILSCQKYYCWIYRDESPFILKKQLRNPHFFQNCGTFQYNSNNKYHNYESSEDRATVFLKWTVFSKINSLNSPLSHWDPIQPESQLHSNGSLQDPCWHPGLGTQVEQSGPSHPIWQAQWSGALHSPLMHPLMSSWHQTTNPEFPVLICSKRISVFQSS